MHKRKMVDRGFAIQMNKNDFTEGELHQNIIKLLYNSTYKQRAMDVPKIVNDNVIGSTDLLLQYVGYIARHKGAKHLISDAVFELNILQCVCLDVVAFVMTAFVVSIYLLYLSIKITFRIFYKAKYKNE